MRSPCSGRLRRLLGVALLATACAAVGGSSRAEAPKPYRPIPAEVGAAVDPPPDLIAAAARLHEAAAAGDAAAAFAMLSGKLVIVSSGITASVRRRAETLGPWRDATAALAAVGNYFEEGDLPEGALGAADHAVVQALDTIAQATANPEWGRDPLVKGGVCTYRGLRWDAAAAARIDGGARGLHVLAPTPARASAADDAEILDTLRPGLIYLEDYLDETPEGWRGVRLPSGRVGAVRDATVRDLAVWGLCFVPGSKGSWRVGAFSSALL